MPDHCEYPPGEAPSGVRRRFRLLIGTGLVDLEDPQPEQLDLTAIDLAVNTIRRFSGNPFAMFVGLHEEFVEHLMNDWLGPEAHPDAIWWARRHDRHEGIIGDVPGPLGALIAMHTPILRDTKVKLDKALCRAWGKPYPDVWIRNQVGWFDRLAETLEWRFILRQPLAGWNATLPDTKTEQEWEWFIRDFTEGRL